VGVQLAKTKFSVIVGAGFVGCSLFAAVVEARPFRVAQVPNGSVNSCATCHLAATGGGPRNPFGVTVETSYLSVPGSTGNVMWSSSLAAIDSDGDGRSNGTELLDPGGLWTIGAANPGTPALVTNPGVAPSPVPALGSIAAGLLGAVLVGLGRSLARRRS
jgi:hypothetical protein